WDVSKVIFMHEMFRGAISFNQDISSWNTSSVTRMNQMFQGASSFNQDIGGWNVSSVTDMAWIFSSAHSFNQDLSSWDVSGATNDFEYGLRDMFTNSNLSNENYDKVLVAWSNLPLQQNITFGVGSTQYSEGIPAQARQRIIDNFGWTIVDGGSTGFPFIGEIDAPLHYCTNIIFPGTYTLQRDLSSTQNCIEIQSDNVTINGNGFRINATTNPIVFSNVTNITIQNAIITSHDYAFAYNYTNTNITLTNTTIDTINFIDYNSQANLQFDIRDSLVLTPNLTVSHNERVNFFNTTYIGDITPTSTGFIDVYNYRTINFTDILDRDIDGLNIDIFSANNSLFSSRIIQNSQISDYFLEYQLTPEGKFFTPYIRDAELINIDINPILLQNMTDESFYSSLRAHFTFDLDNKTHMKDSSNNKIHFIYQGIPHYEDYLFGRSLDIGNFSFFNSPSQGIISVFSYNDLNLSDDFTFSLWTKYTNSNSRGIFNQISSSDSQRGFSLSWTLGPRLRISDSNSDFVAQTDSLSPDEWYHVVFQYNSTHFNIYLNSVLVDSVFLNGVKINSTENISFRNAHSAVKSLLDEIMIFNTSLTPSQILEIYANQSTRFLEKSNTLVLPETIVESGFDTVELQLQGLLNKTTMRAQIEVLDEGIWMRKPFQTMIYNGTHHSATFTISPNVTMIKPILETQSLDSFIPQIINSAILRMSISQKINEYRVRIDENNFYLGEIVNISQSNLLQITLPQDTVHINVTNDFIQRYSRLLGTEHQKNITITTTNSPITDLHISFNQTSIGQQKYGYTTYTTNCETIQPNQECTITFNLTVNPDLPTSYAAEHIATITYRTYNGTYIQEHIPFSSILETFIELEFTPDNLIFNQTNIQNTQIIDIDFTNIGSNPTGPIALSATHPFIDFLYEEVPESNIPSLGPAATNKIQARLQLTNLTHQTYQGYITFTFNGMQQIPYTVNVIQNTTYSQTQFIQQHNTSVEYPIYINNTGNVQLVNILQTYQNYTLPQSWISFEPIVGTIDSEESVISPMTITVPEYTPPGEYEGVVQFEGQWGFVQNHSIRVIVPTNRTWSITPTRHNYEMLITEAPQEYKLPSFNITNAGNVPINYTVAFTYGGDSFNLFPSARHDSGIISYLQPTTQFTVYPGQTYIYNTSVQSYDDAADAPPNMRLAMNFTIQNQTDTNQASQLVDYIINVVDLDPFVDSWRYENNLLLEPNAPIEIYKPFTIQARIFDDGGNINLSTARFTIDDGITNTTYEPTFVNDATATLHRYYLTFTPQTDNPHTIWVYVEENNNPQKAANESIQLQIMTRPQIAFLDTSAIQNRLATNKSNQTHNVTLEVPFTITSQGGQNAQGQFFTNADVLVYNITYSATVPDGWQSQIQFSEILSQANEAIPRTLNITIPKGTPVDNYTVTLQAQFTNPDRTQTTITRPITVKVLPNYDYEIFVTNNTITQEHGTQKITTIFIQPRGNAHTTVTLQTQNAQYTTQFLDTTYKTVGGPYTLEYNRLSPLTISMRTSVPQHANESGSFDVHAQNAQGQQRSIPLQLTIPEDDTISVSTNQIGENVIAGDTYDISFINFTNLGNIPVQLNFSLDGEIVNIADPLFGGSGITIPESVTLIPSQTYPLPFIFTVPSTETTIRGNLTYTQNQNETLIPVELNTYSFSLSLSNRTSKTNLLAQDPFTYRVLLTDALGEAIEQNITFSARVGEQNCPLLEVNQVMVDDLVYHDVTCQLPSRPDGLTHPMSITVTYNSPIIGLTSFVRNNIFSVHYKDITPPEVLTFTMNDTQANQPIRFSSAITDNVYDLVPVKNDYTVRLRATHTQTQTQTVIPFSYNVLSQNFQATHTFALPGLYSYIIEAIDPAGNMNNSYQGTFVLFEERLFTGNFSFTNEFGIAQIVNPRLEFTDSSQTISIQPVNGLYSSVIRTGIFNVSIIHQNKRLTIASSDLLQYPQEHPISYMPLEKDRYAIYPLTAYSQMSTDKIYDGFVFSVPTSSSFRVFFNYSSYQVLQPNGLKVMACPNFNLTTYLHGNRQFACQSGWNFLNTLDIPTAVDTQYFGSAVDTIADTMYAVIFFEYFTEGDPSVQFGEDSLSFTLDHNQTYTHPFSIRASSSGGSLINGDIMCDTSSSFAEFCDIFTISPITFSSISSGTTHHTTLQVTVPYALDPGEYEGRLLYRSNLATTRPLYQSIPITITVLPLATYDITSQEPGTIVAGANQAIRVDSFQIKNTGNVEKMISFESDSKLLSPSSLFIPKQSTINYHVDLQAPFQRGNWMQSVTLDQDHTFTYDINVTHEIEIVSITPSQSLLPNQTIDILFNVYNENGIIDTNSQYFSQFQVKIGGQICTSSTEQFIRRVGQPDRITCTVPELIQEQENYTLQLAITLDGVTPTGLSQVTYQDVLPPTFVFVQKTIEYANISQVHFNLTDMSQVEDQSVRVQVRNSQNQLVYEHIGVGNSSQANLSVENVTYTFSYEFAQADSYVLTIDYCDTFANCDRRFVRVSHFPVIEYIAPPGQSIGRNSAIVSSIIHPDLQRVTSHSQDSKIFFKDPQTREILYDGYTDTLGRFSLFALQNRTYDLQIQRPNAKFLFESITYTGQSLLSFEQVTPPGLNHVKASYGIEPEVEFTQAQVQFNVSSQGLTRSQAYVVICRDFDYASLSCSDQQVQTLTNQQLNPQTIDGRFIFTFNTSEFSVFSLVIPPPITVPPQSSPQSPITGGGGGGSGGSGASIEQIKEALNLTLRNISRVEASRPRDIQANTQNIDQTLYYGETATINIDLTNSGNATRMVQVELTDGLQEVVQIQPEQFSILPGQNEQIQVQIRADQSATKQIYDGFIFIELGAEVISIPVKIRLLDIPEQRPALQLSMLTPSVSPGGVLRYTVEVRNPYAREMPASISYEVYRSLTDTLVYSNIEQRNISKDNPLWTIAFPLNSSFSLGPYFIIVRMNYIDIDGSRQETSASRPFEISENWFFYTLFTYGIFVIRVWHVLLLVSILLLGIQSFKTVRNTLEKRRKYHLPVEFKLLPRAGESSGFIGHLAETRMRSFVEMEQLKMHTLVAGSTGGGKSFASQVIIEEALKKNVAVVVFDPTAQWTGFLRKLTSKRVLNLYDKFRMNPKKDPQAFKGNIRRVENPREIIELKEYLKPGEITVIDMHKMRLEDIDLFVANTVSQVFLNELEEKEDLKLLMVYDEVHRLLPKFGGSGAGFMQIERACREFRKWGIGLVLVSQVLSDFIGQIKANINTEIQMRTRDEDDLKRLSLKYGEQLFQAVIKADVGTGMIQNSKFNKGRPYLVSFRPVLHEIERLSEQDLKKYDHYNNQILDIKYMLEQLSQKQDIMDFQVEVDLAVDKLKEARFDVVDIYLDEIKIKVQRACEKHGLTWQKREIKLIDEAVLQKFISLAHHEHKQAVKGKSEQPVEDAIETSATKTKEDSQSQVGEEKVEQTKTTKTKEEPQLQVEKEKSVETKQPTENKLDKLKKLLNDDD
ncbi:MAG: BspA family leucine-rich repeat surface protein, partial [Candidatus Woesearchaeota archaeon]